MSSLLDNVDLLFWLGGGLLTLAAAVGLVHNKIVKPIMKTFSRWDNSIATLQGYDAIRDPEGTILKPATPPLAARVTDIEGTLEGLSETLSRLVDIFDRLLSLEERYAEHIQWSSEWTTGTSGKLEQFDLRMDRIEAAIGGRRASDPHE